jgi:hypothetical protein
MIEISLPPLYHNCYPIFNSSCLPEVPKKEPFLAPWVLVLPIARTSTVRIEEEKASPTPLYQTQTGSPLSRLAAVLHPQFG